MTKTNFILIFIILILLSLYIKVDRQNSELRDREVIPRESKPSRGYDYKENKYIELSDEEIRNLRMNNPEYVIEKTGKIILSEEQEFEKNMDEYLKHNPEVIQEWKDKYGDN